jgi:hypothetical protein
MDEGAAFHDPRPIKGDSVETGQALWIEPNI